jgi:hypothetical protein
MIKETLVGVGAALAGAGAYFYGVIPAVTPYITTGIGTVEKIVTTSPLFTTAATAVAGVVASVAIHSVASKKQEQISADASQKQNDILSQADALLTQKDGRIVSLETKVNELTKQVADTAQLNTQIASLQTELSTANLEAQRVRDEYNALIRIKAVAESLPVQQPTVQ